MWKVSVTVIQSSSHLISISAFKVVLSRAEGDQSWFCEVDRSYRRKSGVPLLAQNDTRHNDMKAVLTHIVELSAVVIPWLHSSTREHPSEGKVSN